jgi:AcrR family transcriptional regulator
VHDDLRNAVLDAARRMLVSHGYASVSMRRIADEVGCSVSSIYLYFAGKDDLVHTLIDEGFQRWYDRSSGHVNLLLSPAQRLDHHCRTYVEWGLENPELYQVMYMFRPERMARYPREMYRRAARSMDILTELVADCAPAAFASSEDARIAAHVVWAILHGIVSTIVAQRLDRRIDQGRYIDLSIRSAVVGVERLAAPVLL